MLYWVVLGIGLCTGALLGVFLMALLVMAKEEPPKPPRPSRPHRVA